MRIPGYNDLSGLHLIAFLDNRDGSIRNLVTLAFTTMLVDHADLTGP